MDGCSGVVHFWIYHPVTQVAAGRLTSEVTRPQLRIRLVVMFLGVWRGGACPLRYRCLIVAISRW